MTGGQQRLTGTVQVDLPPAEAFCLFTPRGEEDWAQGWHPRFPVPAPGDSGPATVFETATHGQHTIWLVTDRQPGKRISYARVTPGHQAGTVTVTINAAGHGSEAEVTYLPAVLGQPAGHRRAIALHRTVIRGLGSARAAALNIRDLWPLTRA